MPCGSRPGFAETKPPLLGGRTITKERPRRYRGWRGKARSGLCPETHQGRCPSEPFIVGFSGRSPEPLPPCPSGATLAWPPRGKLTMSETGLRNADIDAALNEAKEVYV